MHPSSIKYLLSLLPMSSTEASAARRARMPTLRVVSCVSLMSLTAFTGDAAAAALGKTYFYATRDACVSAGAFNGRECAAAFANARAQLYDQAPRFARSSECRLRFHICEPVRVDPAADEQGADGAPDAMSYAPSDETAYAPAALGVEIVASRNGAVAAPTLAIETPERLFPYYPVARPYEPGQEGQSIAARSDDAARRDRREQQNAAILAPDHFEPFSRRKPVAGATTFTASALGAIEATAPSVGESVEDRRMRLRNAPFVE
jgi:hypothetical protein